MRRGLQPNVMKQVLELLITEDDLLAVGRELHLSRSTIQRVVQTLRCLLPEPRFFRVSWAEYKTYFAGLKDLPTLYQTIWEAYRTAPWHDGNLGARCFIRGRFAFTRSELDVIKYRVPTKIDARDATDSPLDALTFLVKDHCRRVIISSNFRDDVYLLETAIEAYKRLASNSDGAEPEPSM